MTKMKVRKALSMVLVCLIIATCFVSLLIPAFAAANGEADDNFSIWDGSTDTDWESVPNEENAYYITSAAELAGLASVVNSNDTQNSKNLPQPTGYTSGNVSSYYGYTFYITIDIDISANEWTPIGKSNNIGFGGTLVGMKDYKEGASVIIKGMSINATFGNVGLVGSMGYGGIKNITLEKASVTSDSNTVGSFVGYERYGVCVYENLKSDAVITSSGEKLVGGIVAYSNVEGTVFRNCTFTGSITTNNAYAKQIGGITGYAKNTSFEFCTVTGSITVNGTDSNYIGGILGQPDDTVTFTSCTVIGDITSKSKYSKGVKLGGIVGAVPGNGVTLEKCYVSSTITSNCKHTGGMIGCVEANRTVTFTDCQFDGIVNGGATQIGAFIGRYDTDANGKAITFTRCLNTGISQNTYASVDSVATSVSWVGLAANKVEGNKGNLTFTDCASLSDTPILGRTDAGPVVYTVNINGEEQTITATAADSLSHLRVDLITWENGKAIVPAAISGDTWTAREGMYPVLTDAADVALTTYGMADLSWFDGAPAIIAVNTYGQLLGLARIYKLFDLSSVPVKAVPQELREYVSELFDEDFSIRLAPALEDDTPGNETSGNDNPDAGENNTENSGNAESNDRPGQKPSTTIATEAQETPDGSNTELTPDGGDKEADKGCASTAIGVLPILLISVTGMAIAKKGKAE